MLYFFKTFNIQFKNNLQDVGGLESMRNLEQYLPGDARNSGVFSPQDPSGKGNERPQYILFINLPFRFWQLIVENISLV